MDDQVLKQEISVRFQQARKALGMTPPALAKELGAAAQTIRDYEDAKSIPGGAVIAGLCELNINPHWLLVGVGHMFLGQKEEPKPALEINAEALAAIMAAVEFTNPKASPPERAAIAAKAYVASVREGLITPTGQVARAPKSAA